MPGIKNMEKQRSFSLRKQIASFKPAFKGLAFLLKNEHNFRIHVAATLIVIVLGILFRIRPIEWIAVVLCFGLVISTEIMNTAVEKLVDFVSPQNNEKAGQIKDIAAAAVLVSACIAFIAGLIIFLPYLFRIS
jgi:diacylglycerol kinase (ATP)